MPQLETFLQEIHRHRPLSPEEATFVEKVYRYSEKAHAGQKRRSGDPYFTHLVAVALMVARWKLDATTIAAALLHDVLEDTDIKESELRERFGDEVTFLVQGLTKVSRVKYRGNKSQVETLKKMVFALSEDIRVVFVKLADRYHNMQTLNYLPPEKQKRIALETNEIYAPLAYRLGLTSVSGDLEDMAFPYLNPEEHRLLRDTLKEHLATGNKYMERVKKRLTEELTQHPIHVLRIDSRAKRLSSLYKKLRRTGMDLQNIYDLIALRLIVGSVEDCYATLGLIHSLWPPLPGRIKDYIALPKPNGYRSLHTTVICLDNRPTEFQIRTEEMHYENEYGIAAYWAYSEAKGTEAYAQARPIYADAAQVQWISQLKNWQSELQDQDEFIRSLKIDFFQERIFVITPKGEVIDLAAGATPIDFAYAIHSEVGDHCAGARVNGRIVPLYYQLQSGDVVEIITQKNKKPNEAWLKVARTSRARTRIRSALREKGGGLVPNVTKITIVAEDKIGLMKEVSSIFATNRINMLNVSSPNSKTGSLTTIRISIPSESRERLDRVLLKLQKIKQVKQVSVGT
jgi:guanosine-3',5'-bis(diphosphate) 3'-pyrophosphohydrolase